MKGERGFALVITLIITALLVALIVEFVNETYVGTVNSHNFVASQQAQVLSESGTALGRKILEYELAVHPAYTSFLDMWAQPLEPSDEIGKLSVTIEEESGKLNLNTIGAPKGPDTSGNYVIAQDLFRQLDLAPELANAIVDWTGDPTAPPMPYGGKSPYYNSLTPPYDVKGDKLDTVEELGLVKGFTPEIVAKLKPYVTVYFGSSMAEPVTKINVNTAPRELLAALDPTKMTDDLVNRILEYRKTKPIKNLADVPGCDVLAAPLAMKVSFQGYVYRIQSRATVGESVSVTEAVVRVTGNSSEILYWRQY